MASRVDIQAIYNLENWRERLIACKNEAQRALDDLETTYKCCQNYLIDDHLEEFSRRMNEIKNAIDDLDAEIKGCDGKIKEKVLKLKRLIYRK